MARLQAVKKEEGETYSIWLFKRSWFLPFLNTVPGIPTHKRWCIERIFMKFSLRVLLNFESLGLLNFSGDKFDFGTSAEDASGIKVFFTSWKPAPQNYTLRVVVERVWMVDSHILNFSATRLKGKRGEIELSAKQAHLVNTWIVADSWKGCLHWDKQPWRGNQSDPGFCSHGNAFRIKHVWR